MSKPWFTVSAFLTAQYGFMCDVILFFVGYFCSQYFTASQEVGSSCCFHFRCLFSVYWLVSLLWSLPQIALLPLAMSGHLLLQNRSVISKECLQYTITCLVRVLSCSQTWVISDGSEEFWEEDFQVMCCLAGELVACDLFLRLSFCQGHNVRISRKPMLWPMPPFQFVHKDILCQSLHMMRMQLVTTLCLFSTTQLPIQMRMHLPRF